MTRTLASMLRTTQKVLPMKPAMLWSTLLLVSKALLMMPPKALLPLSKVLAMLLKLSLIHI